MSDRRIAMAALILAGAAFLFIAIHALIPTPPAHTRDPFRLGT